MGQSKEDLAKALQAFEAILAKKGAFPEDIGQHIPDGLAGDSSALLAARRRAGLRAHLNHVAYRLVRAKTELAQGELKLARRSIFWISGAVYVIEAISELDYDPAVGLAARSTG